MTKVTYQRCDWWFTESVIHTVATDGGEAARRVRRGGGGNGVYRPRDRVLALRCDRTSVVGARRIANFGALKCASKGPPPPRAGDNSTLANSRIRNSFVLCDISVIFTLSYKLHLRFLLSQLGFLFTIRVFNLVFLYDIYLVLCICFLPNLRILNLQTLQSVSFKFRNILLFIFKRARVCAFLFNILFTKTICFVISEFARYFFYFLFFIFLFKLLIFDKANAFENFLLLRVLACFVIEFLCFLEVSESSSKWENRFVELFRWCMGYCLEYCHFAVIQLPT